MQRHATQCTILLKRSDFSRSDLFELCVTLDKLLGSAAGKADGQPAVVVIAFDAHNGAHAEIGVAHLSAKQGIGIAATFCGGSCERARALLAPRGGRRVRFRSAYTTKEFIRGVGIFGIGLVSARLADLRHGSADGVHQLAWYFA